MNRTHSTCTGDGRVTPRFLLIISQVSILLMLLSVTGCSTSAPEQTEPPPPPAPMEQEQQEHNGHDGHMMSGSNSAAYMTLRNNGSTPDALVAASTDAADLVELHTVIEENGVMKMRPVPQIAIPAAGEQQLRPGGYHVMLIGITRDLEEGDTIDLTLTLEHAGPIELSVPVQMMEPEDTASETSISSDNITVESPWVRAAVMAPSE